MLVGNAQVPGRFSFCSSNAWSAGQVDEALTVPIVAWAAIRVPWDPIKQKIHSVGELVVAFVLVGRGGPAGGLGSAFVWSGLDLPGARCS